MNRRADHRRSGYSDTLRPTEILPYIKIPLVPNPHPLQVDPRVGFLRAFEGFRFVSAVPCHTIHSWAPGRFLAVGPETDSISPLISAKTFQLVMWLSVSLSMYFTKVGKEPTGDNVHCLAGRSPKRFLLAGVSIPDRLVANISVASESLPGGLQRDRRGCREDRGKSLSSCIVSRTGRMAISGREWGGLVE